jgi:cation-transporting ATPase 13A1
MVDLEAEFTPSLLNSAVYLLQLIQQISTFAVNYQGRPFRESISENKGMFWGILGVTAIAFSCSTEFIPEINQQMKLVPFKDEFKMTLTAVMVIDYAACWLIEVVLKWAFSDFRPRDIAERRPEQLERERVRKAEEQRLKDEEAERVRLAKVAELEAKVEARAQAIRAWSTGQPQAQRVVPGQ